MVRKWTTVLLILILTISVAICGENEIQYWADVLLDIDDYQNNSKDKDALGFSKTGSKYESVKAQLISSFERHIQRKNKRLSIYNQYEEKYRQMVKQKTVYSDDLSTFIANYLKAQTEVSAMAAANIRASHGSGAGVFLCEIRIKRRDFPILYEIEFKYNTDEDLGLKSGKGLWETISKDIGYSTKEDIESELKVTIEETLSGWKKRNFAGFLFYGEE